MRDPAQIESRRRALRSLITRRDTPEQRYRDNDGVYEEPTAPQAEPGLFDDLQSINEPMHPMTKVAIGLLLITLCGALGGALVQLFILLLAWAERPAS